MGIVLYEQCLPWLFCSMIDPILCSKFDNEQMLQKMSNVAKVVEWACSPGPGPLTTKFF